jgi:hypothetical protein
MNKLCTLLNLKTEDELFDKITQSLKKKLQNQNIIINDIKKKVKEKKSNPGS